MLTKGLLDELKPGTIYQQGICMDAPSDMNINNSGALMRYVAIIGGAKDWAVYVAPIHWNPIDIAQTGDKINVFNACLVVRCTDTAMERYRG